MKINVIFLRIIMIILILFFLFLISYYFPNNIINERTLLNNYKENERIFPIITMIIIDSLCLLSIVFIIIFFWKISIYINKDELISINVLKILRIILITLSIALAVFIISNICFYNLKWSNTSLIYIFFSLFGIICIPFIAFLYYMIKEQSESNNLINE